MSAQTRTFLTVHWAGSGPPDQVVGLKAGRSSTSLYARFGTQVQESLVDEVLSGGVCMQAPESSCA